MITNLLKTSSISGRCSRPDFWVFFAIWSPLALYLSWFFSPPIRESYFGAKIFLFSSAFFLPLFSAAARRLNDVGEHGQDAFLPLAPLAMVYGVFIGIPLLFLSSSMGFWSAQSIYGDSLASFTLLIGGMFGVFAYLAFIPALIIALIATVVMAASVLGQLFLPSQVGPNTYGPNPNEALP